MVKERTVPQLDSMDMDVFDANDKSELTSHDHEAEPSMVLFLQVKLYIFYVFRNQIQFILKFLDFIYQI